PIPFAGPGKKGGLPFSRYLKGLVKQLLDALGIGAVRAVRIQRAHSAAMPWKIASLALWCATTVPLSARFRVRQVHRKSAAQPPWHVGGNLPRIWSTPGLCREHQGRKP